MLLKDKVAVVTGGANGMGRAISLRFAKEGCAVVVTDVDVEGTKAVVDEIAAAKGKGLALKLDITKSAEAEAVVARTIKEFGKIDILVNNAGGVKNTGTGGDSLLISEEEWDRIVTLNLKGHFLVTKAVMPEMKKNKYGKIVNLSSMGAVQPSISVLHYHSAKGGVLAMSLNLAFELAPFGICVNAIVPGPIETPFWDALMPRGPERDAFFAALAKKEVPLGRVGQPEDIAKTALYLASDLSDFVSGQTICVAGGLPLLTRAATFDMVAYFENKNK